MKVNKVVRGMIRQIMTETTSFGELPKLSEERESKLHHLSMTVMLRLPILIN